MEVIKRNGERVAFNREKIVVAIQKAIADVKGKKIEESYPISIAKTIEDMLVDKDTPTVEQIQDYVELLLMSVDPPVAKAYILYRNNKTQLRQVGWVMTDLQKDIYEQKYRHGNESFDEFLERVSGGDAYIKKAIRDRRFLPAGRILASRGLNRLGKKVSYSNCFVIKPPTDNLESIFDAAKKMARTYSYGGGCGTSLGNLRPRGAEVRNAAKMTTGAVSFMDLYSTTTGLIGQANRRGALMLSMPVTHPDIIEFIGVKNDLEKVTKANISVMVTDDFMKAVEEDKIWKMEFVVEDTGEIITDHAPAREIFRMIAEHNHRMGEPGFLYWDRVQNWHINSENKNVEYVSTNPCNLICKA